jgi:hypothetical protein
MKSRIKPHETALLILLILALYGLAGSLEDENTEPSNWLLTLTTSNGDL